MPLFSSALTAKPAAAVPGTPKPPSTDPLFATIERWNGERPWGRVLDAGTGRHSLEWILSLPTTSWHGVTAGAPGEGELRRAVGERMRPVDRLISGNWLDPAFLDGQRYDTVLADYLLGAIDGFAPYFQDRLFARLRPHVAGTLFVVGLEPYADPPGDEAGAIILEIARLRDACILLAGHRCYREYPRTWAERSLEGAGYSVRRADSLPIVYGHRFIDGQLDVCERKLPLFHDRALAGAMGQAIRELRVRAKAVHDRLGGLRCSADWVIEARPA